MDHSRVLEIFTHEHGRFDRSKDLAGNLLLLVETEQILIAPGPIMQKAANRTHEFGRLLQQLQGRIRTGLSQLGQPMDQMQIAESAGCFFYVRLQVVESILIFVVTSTGQLPQVTSQHARLPFFDGRQLAVKSGNQFAVSGQHPTVEQADIQLDVLLLDFGAFGQRADRVAQAEPGVPYQTYKVWERIFQCGGLCFPLHQDHDVHVGIGKQLPPPEASHRQHRQAAGKRRRKRRLVGLDRYPIDQFGESAEDRAGLGGPKKRLLNLFPGGVRVQLFHWAGGDTQAIPFA